MIKICPLFSGSSGNSTYIGYKTHGVLVDAGKNAKQIETALCTNEIDAKKIEAIFVTHEHTDHTSGLAVFAGKHGIPVYSSKGTIKELEKKTGYEKLRFFEMEKNANFNFINAKSFKTSHDAAESFGFVFTFENGKKISVCTDLGIISEEIKYELSNCNAVVIESNHDEMMLQNGRYPYFLKRRILSEIGHLSNETCANFLPYLIKNGTTKIVLAHLSQENNVPELAFETAISTLKKHRMKNGKDFLLHIAKR